MAEIKFSPNSPAYYGDVTKADRPKSSGLTLVKINRYSGKPLVDTDVAYYGNKPGDVIERLYKDGIPAQGFINNKFYRDGQELSAEQVQAQRIENIIGIEGALATVGLRTPVGPGGEKFVRDTEAEKKFAAEIKEAAKLALKQGTTIIERGVAFTARAGGMSDKEYANYLINASDEQIIANVGGVNKEGITGSNFGINTKMPFPEGTVNTQYTQGSRAITESDILALGKAVGNATKDPQAAANASKQLISIFENDSSFVRREQARDALSYGLPGYPGGSKTMGTSTRGATGAGTATSAEGDTGATVTGAGTISNPLRFNQTAYTGEYNGITYVNGVSTIESGKRSERQSAYDSLLVEFNKYGLGSLVSDIRGLIEKDVPPSQFIIELRNTKAYQERFKANAERLKKGLSALNESTYINNEDAYRNTLRTYGLTQFDNDEYVSQFIANDIRPEELTERVSLAVNRVKMADPAITRTLKDYYGLQDADMVASILDPKTQLPRIQRQIAASEIGVAAGRQGFNIGPTIAEQLAAQGVTQAGAQKGYGTIAEILPTAEKLSDIYGKDLERYGLAEAEQEVFNELASAQRKRKRLVEREIAEFSGQSGVTRGSLGSPTGGQY